MMGWIIGINAVLAIVYGYITYCLAVRLEVATNKLIEVALDMTAEQLEKYGMEINYMEAD